VGSIITSRSFSQTLKRLDDIAKLPVENKNFVLNMIDIALRDLRVKKAHVSQIIKPSIEGFIVSVHYKSG
jgi:hypothetical protein